MDRVSQNTLDCLVGKREIIGVDVQNLEIKNIKTESLLFVRSNLMNLKLQNCIIDKISLHGCLFEGISFNKCEIEELVIDAHTYFQNISFGKLISQHERVGHKKCGAYIDINHTPESERPKCFNGHINIHAAEIGIVMVAYQ